MPDVYICLSKPRCRLSTPFSAWDADLCGPHARALTGDQRMEKGGAGRSSGWLGPSPLLTASGPRQRKPVPFCPRPAVADSISFPRNCLLSCLISRISTLFKHFYGFFFSPNREITWKHSGPTFARYQPPVIQPYGAVHVRHRESCHNWLVKDVSPPLWSAFPPAWGLRLHILQAAYPS